MKSPRRHPHDPLSPRKFLWQIIAAYAARGSMPCWALPFEAIAASILLKDRHPKKKPRDKNDLL